MNISSRLQEQGCPQNSCDLNRLMDGFSRSFEQRLAKRGMLLSIRYMEPLPRCLDADAETLESLLGALAECSAAVEARGCAVLDVAAEAAGAGNHTIYIILTLSGKGLPESREGGPARTMHEKSLAYEDSLERARTICRAHGGNIHVENSSGFGTRFMVKICLPPA